MRWELRVRGFGWGGVGRADVVNMMYESSSPYSSLIQRRVTLIKKIVLLNHAVLCHNYLTVHFLYKDNGLLV